MMADQPGFTTHLHGLLRRWSEGDPSAVEEIIIHSQGRLQRMASRMLAAKPHVGRWNQTDDVLQNALIRLHRSLKEVKPETKQGFLGLAATQIRRELIDMARSLYGPEGHGRHHKTDEGQPQADGSYRPLYDDADPATGPLEQLQNAELHETIGKLPQEQRELFDLLFYHGMPQNEVAEQKDVSVRTIKRRWREARLSLKAILDAEDI